ncbi:MAG: radical SAM protein [candidate division WOR-3 bacterium]
MKTAKRIDKICLIDPTCLSDKWKISTHSMREPLGIECIGAVLKASGYNVKILQQRELNDEEFIQKIIEFDPQVAGFTSYSYNFHRACKLARKLKQKKPNIINIFGGYHVSFCLEESKKPFIDFIVIGEGEITTLELINALNDGNEVNNIKGIAYFNRGEIKITSRRNRIKHLDNLPFALRDEKILKNLKVDGLMYPPPSMQRNPALIFSSRGCPYNCYYCASPRFYGSYVSYRSIKNVAKELKTLNEQFGTNVFYFTDLTFNLNKNYVRNLCKQIIQEKLKIYWYVLCRPDNLDEETIKLMKAAGCTKIGFGIDSVSNKILKHINRKISIEKLADVFQMVSDHGIIVRATMMFGFPWDTSDTYEYSLNLLNKLPIDEIRIAIFAPYPGTGFFEKYRDYIISFNYEKYDSQTPLVKTKDIKQKEIQEYVVRAYRSFYASNSYKERVKQKIKKFPELEKSYIEFKKHLKIMI